jgi:hypothetical protein
VIYIDNPVGTGFSFTSGGYAENETAVADDLFDCIIQLFTLFPEFEASFVPVAVASGPKFQWYSQKRGRLKSERLFAVWFSL